MIKAVLYVVLLVGGSGIVSLVYRIGRHLPYLLQIFSIVATNKLSDNLCFIYFFTLCTCKWMQDGCSWIFIYYEHSVFAILYIGVWGEVGV